MSFHFSKYCGAGNDFIVIDDRSKIFPTHSTYTIASLCHRQNGIGADGIVLLQEATYVSWDFCMRIFNADGSEAEMCGNGLRCFAKFLLEKGMPKRPYRIEALAGTFRIEFEEELVRTYFAEACLLCPAIPIYIGQKQHEFVHLNTGVPHAVTFVDSLRELQLLPLNDTAGPRVRHYPLFGLKGANANFAYYDKTSSIIYLRTYERGVEAETLACGTGVVATAIAANYLYNLPPPITIEAQSKEQMTVQFSCTKRGEWKEVSLLGPAHKVFEGVVAIDEHQKTEAK